MMTETEKAGIGAGGEKFDCHIHSFGVPGDPEALLCEMEKCGIYGGCVFSNCPPEYDPVSGTSFESRMDELAAWTKGYGGRLFPVLWIHPGEKDIKERMTAAAGRGVAAFKIICGDFFVYEERSLDVLRHAARLGKPVFFHSGILWNGTASSDYNRPGNWEALLPIKGLRFSMGHCSWPWTDECIALYGKFSFAARSGNTSEMFLDTTPGTPAVYRRDFLTRLVGTGYDLSGRVMFGTDSSACEYSAAYTAEWMDRDRGILESIGAAERLYDDMYRGSLMRFLGIG